MLKIIDTLTDETFNCEDIDEYRAHAQASFDASVHNVIDDMCDAYKHGDYIGAYEQYLGIRITA